MTTPSIYSLLNPEEIIQIFSCGELYDKASFYFIEKDTETYKVDRDKSNFLLESEFIYQKYKDGHTIIVKNLKNYNKTIRKKCAELGKDVDVHMYLVPPNGTDSFPYHRDERDVVVHLVHGEKIFYIKDETGEITKLCRLNDQIH